jgi:hypothetical protein
MDLPSFYPRRPLPAADLNALANEIRAQSLCPGQGYRINRTPGGTTLVIDQNQSSPSDQTKKALPFELYRGTGYSDFAVGLGYLSKAAGTQDTQTITGLYENNSVSVGDIVFLTVTFDENYAVSSAYIEVGSTSAWTNFPDPAEYDETNIDQQTKYHHLIAQIVETTDTRDGTEYALGEAGDVHVKVIQLLKTNLCLFLTALHGRGAVIALPWQAPYA